MRMIITLAALGLFAITGCAHDKTETADEGYRQQPGSGAGNVNPYNAPAAPRAPALNQMGTSDQNGASPDSGTH